MKILFLADNLANAKQWKGAMEKYGRVNITQWELKGKNRIERFAYYIFALIFIKKILKKYKPDMVIGYRTTSYGFLAARSGIKPCVIAAQGENDIWPRYGITVPLKKWMQKYACQKADLIHAWGEHMKQSILTTNVDEKKVIVRPRGIDLHLFRPFNKRMHLKESIKIISTRSLYPEYDHKIILKALYELQQKGIKFQYYIVGEGPSENKLKQVVRDLGLKEKVDFVGKIDNQHLADYLNASDVYVSMPHTEGVSASLFEAMACGCIPVVSDLKANRLFVEHGKNGFLVPVGDKYFLAESLTLIVENNFDWQNCIKLNMDIVAEKADLEKNIRYFIYEYKNLIYI
jgi:glycosyltransferase involved in cell wall biosynthesis